MTASQEYYLERAAECALAAAQTSLVNERERYARSEVQWRAMADRLRSVEDHRERNMRAKGERPPALSSAQLKSMLIRQRLYG